MKKIDCVLSYVMQIIITIIGTIGIINTVLTSEFGYIASNGWLYAFIIIVSIVFVTAFNIKRHRVRIAAGAAILIAAGVFIWRESIMCGIAYIIDEFISYVGREKGINISAYRIELGGMSEALYMEAAVTATIIAAVIVACIVSINVVMLRSMLYGIITIVPLMFLMISYNIIPTSGSIFLCLVYVMCTAAMKRGSQKSKPAMIIMVSALIVYGLAVLIINEDDYNKPRFFTAVDNFIDRRFSNSKELLFMGTENKKDSESSEGGYAMPGGKELGTVEKVEYRNKKVAVITTQLTGSRQYIPTFYGRDYRYRGNRWSNNGGYDENHDVNKNFFMMLEGNNTNYKGVADTRARYDELVEIYSYTYKAADSTYTPKPEFGYNVDASAVRRLSAIGSGSYRLTEPNNNIHMNQWEFSRYEAENKQSAKYKWLDIDENIENRIKSIINVPSSCSSSEEILNYVRYVRQYLATNYEYTLEPGKVPENTDFATYFLTNSKKGYCVHFATSAVLMFRAAGIPARYIEGFVLTPDEIRDGKASEAEDEWYKIAKDTKTSPKVTNYTLDVKDTASHAWVEIYFAGYGWLPVEVTPPYAGIGIMGTNDERLGNDEDEMQQPETELQTESESGDENESNSENQSETHTQNDDTQNQGSGFGVFTGLVNFVKKFWAVMLAAAAILAVIIGFAVRYNARKRRLNKVLKENLIGSYEVLEKLLGYIGYRRPDNMTYELYAEYLKSAEEIFARHNIVYITEMALKLQLSGDDKAVSKEEQIKLCRDIRAIRRAIIEKMPLLKRLQIKYFMVL